MRREQEEKKSNYDKQLDDLEKWHDDQEDYYEEYYDDLDGLTYEFLQKMRKAYNDDFAKIIEETQKLINSIDVPHGSVNTGISGSFIQGSLSGGSSSSNGSSISGSSNGIYAGMTDSQKANEEKYLNSIINNPNSSAGNKIWAENQLKDLYGYAEGGVATYTGLAKLHGTPNNPEVIFNAKDAQKLYDLIHYNLIPIPRFNNNWQFSEANKGTGVSSITIEKVEFPNATNSNEIKEALLSLPRVVLQY